jgi:phosphatidate cytidylyltransferase
MLRWRLTLGVLLIAVLVALCWLDHQAATPGIWLLPLALVLSVLASHEVIALLAARGLRPLPWLIYGGNLLIVASNAAVLVWPQHRLGALGWPLSTFALAMIAAFAGEMRRYERPGEVSERLALGVFGLAYVGVLLSFVVQLRLLDLALGGGRWGVSALISLIIVVKMCDTGAYTAGRLFGRHKMAPVLSPGKTIEGAIGGLIFSVAGAWIAFGWLVPAMSSSIYGPRSWWTWTLFGLLVGAVGMLGDLAESLLKRDLGRKDSGAWVPGFGGVLDILDSILIGAPVAYLCWIFGLVGP